MHRFFIERLELNSGSRKGDGPKYAIDCLVAPMRAGHAVADRSRCQFLALHERPYKSRCIDARDVTGVLQASYDLTDRLFLGSRQEVRDQSTGTR